MSGDRQTFEEITASIDAEMRRTAASARIDAILAEYRPIRERTEARMAQLRAGRRPNGRGSARADYMPPISSISARAPWWA